MVRGGGCVDRILVLCTSFLEENKRRVLASSYFPFSTKFTERSNADLSTVEGGWPAPVIMAIAADKEVVS